MKVCVPIKFQIDNLLRLIFATSTRLSQTPLLPLSPPQTRISCQPIRIDTNGAFHNLLHPSISNGMLYQSSGRRDVSGDAFVIAGPHKVCNNHFTRVISIEMGQASNQPWPPWLFRLLMMSFFSDRLLILKYVTVCVFCEMAAHQQRSKLWSLLSFTACWLN